MTRGLSVQRLQDGLDLLKTLETGATAWKLPNLEPGSPHVRSPMNLPSSSTAWARPNLSWVNCA